MVRREIALAAALVAILAIPALGYLAYERQFHTRMRAVVSQSSGGLELRPSGGAWQPAGRGTRLAAGDELRLPAGSAVIDAEGRYRVELEAGTHIGLSSDAALALEEGAALVQVPAGSVITLVGPAGAVAEVVGGGATFRARRAEGLLVESIAGEVRLRGAAREVDVRAGQRSHVPPGGDPGEPIGALP